MRASIFIILFVLLYAVASSSYSETAFTMKRKSVVLPVPKPYVSFLTVKKDWNETQAINEIKQYTERYTRALVLTDSISFPDLKVEIFDVYDHSGHYAHLKLYESAKSDSIVVSEMRIICYDGLSLRPEISDFNNDGWNDLTIQTAEAVRGANELRTLLLFDSKNHDFIPIKNSYKAPNLHYNKELDCLDSWSVFGGSSTTFYEIKGDSLYKLARIINTKIAEEGYCRELYLTDSSGKSEIIRKDVIGKDDLWTYYSNYDPITF